MNLKNNQDDVINLINIIHYYEAVLANLEIQVGFGEISQDVLKQTEEFALKVTGKTLTELYENQNLIKHESLLDFAHEKSGVDKKCH